MADAHHPAPPFYRNGRRTRPTHQKAQQVNTNPAAVQPAAGRVPNNTATPPVVHTNGKGERSFYRARAVKTVNKITPE